MLLFTGGCWRRYVSRAAWPDFRGSSAFLGAVPQVPLTGLGYSCPPPLKYSALTCMNCFHWAENCAFFEYGVEGAGGSQALQLTAFVGVDVIPLSSSVAWIQSTGQTSTQDASFSPMQGWVMI